MKFLGQKSLLAATTLAFSALRAASAEDADDVLVLGHDNFASTVDPEVRTIVNVSRAKRTMKMLTTASSPIGTHARRILRPMVWSLSSL